MVECVVSELRDYLAWHRHYDDPTSSLSWRLRMVQSHLRAALDARPGPLRILSACSGDGRDVLGVLAERPDADRAEVILLELHPDIAEAARASAAAAGLGRVEVRTVDAGLSGSFAGAVPADVVLLVGIFGNISRADLDQTIDAAPQLCRPGAVLIWSRGLDDGDLNPEIRARFAARGFTELAYDSLKTTALGAVAYGGAPSELVLGRRLFTFLR